MPSCGASDHSPRDEETIRAKSVVAQGGSVNHDEIMRLNDMGEKRQTLQHQLGDSYSVKAYREYIRERKLREPHMVTRVSTPRKETLRNLQVRWDRDQALMVAPETGIELHSVFTPNPQCLMCPRSPTSCPLSAFPSRMPPQRRLWLGHLLPSCSG